MNRHIRTERTGVVYTCITGGYDDLYDHSYINHDWDYVCFTDNTNIARSGSSSWQIRQLVFNKLDNIRNNRWHKIHPHILFPEYQQSIYVDGNINILNNYLFDDVAKVLDKSHKMSVALHPDRSCIYDEFDVCVDIGKDIKELMENQIELIRKDGFPEQQGLFESNIIYRLHHDEKVIAVMEDWWWWIEHYSRRDQLSLTYVLWKHGMSIEPLSEITYRNSNKIEFRYGKKHITEEERIKHKAKRLRKRKRRITYIIISIVAVVSLISLFILAGSHNWLK